MWDSRFHWHKLWFCSVHDCLISVGEKVLNPLMDSFRYAVSLFLMNEEAMVYFMLLRSPWLTHLLGILFQVFQIPHPWIPATRTRTVTGSAWHKPRCSGQTIWYSSAKTPKAAHITPLLYNLHWLPISNLIQYKIALICFLIVSGTAPPYLSELLHLYPPQSLHSASDLLCSQDGQEDSRKRSFHYTMTYDLELSSSLCQAFVFTLFSFKSKLKTHLFS